MAFFELRRGARQARSDVRVIVAAGAQALFEQFHRGRQDEQDHGVRVELANLLSPLHFNLQEHIGAFWCFGQRRAVEMIMEFRPLEKLIRLDRFFKGGAIDVEVFVAVFARSAFAGGPTTT